jgi:Leucine-rich repeat (LRR) protein
MKAFDSDDIKNEILSGDEKRIAFALRRARDFDFDADKFYASVLEICSFLEHTNKRLYSLPGLNSEIETLGLMLNNMNLYDIPNYFSAFCDLTDRIDISNNAFSEFPTVLLEFRQLKQLNLSKNMLTKLPQSFSNFTQLEALDISTNLFVKLPAMLAQIDTLKSLTVNCSNTLYFQPALPKNLEKLGVNFTKTISFPEALYACTSLKIIELEGISELPEAIKKLEKLEVLSIRRAGLETLPESISALTNLKKLTLSNLCLLNKLPDVIFELQNLEALDLSGSPLLELPAKLRQMKNLKSINISGCSDDITLGHWKNRCKSWGIELIA